MAGTSTLFDLLVASWLSIGIDVLVFYTKRDVRIKYSSISSNDRPLVSGTRL
jgi:hypothetical protein